VERPSAGTPETDKATFAYAARLPREARRRQEQDGQHPRRAPRPHGSQLLRRSRHQYVFLFPFLSSFLRCVICPSRRSLDFWTFSPTTRPTRDTDPAGGTHTAYEFWSDSAIRRWLESRGLVKPTEPKTASESVSFAFSPVHFCSAPAWTEVDKSTLCRIVGIDD
jgi:hypothetical protein